MPKYTPSDDDMDQSYSGGAAPIKPPAKPAETESVDEEEAGASEILVAKSQLPAGCKEGDTYTFRVVKDYGDEASLELVEGDETGGETAAEPMSTEGAELAALAGEGE